MHLKLYLKPSRILIATVRTAHIARCRRSRGIL